MMVAMAASESVVQEAETSESVLQEAEVRPGRFGCRCWSWVTCWSWYLVLLQNLLMMLLKSHNVRLLESLS